MHQGLYGGVDMIEVLLVVLGVMVGYNIRHEWNRYKENLILSQVDERLRKELEVARNLNQSLLADLADLKQRLTRIHSKHAE
jgi:hypothetical protein